MTPQPSKLETWSFPTRILFGEGAAMRLAEESVALGGHKILLVSDRGVDATGLLESVKEGLARAHLPFEVVLDISSNPVEDEVLDGARVFGEVGADLVVGIGGGSVLDVAKLIAVAATHPLPLSLYDDAQGGGQNIVGPLPPIIAVPTTAGTGSEVGRSGVVTLKATSRKTVIFSPWLLPKVAILDPVLTQTMPPRVTAATGMDALTHCIEAYCSVGDHPMADAIALSGVALCRKSLRRAVEDGDDLEARSGMLKAAMMGAVAFQKGLGACHSLAHPLSTEFGMHHGLANAICLPPVLDFNRSAIPARIAAVARNLGVRAKDEESLAFECAGAVRALRKAIGLPSDLKSQGIAGGELPRLASLAYEDACHALNPRPCTPADLVSLYRACFDDA